MDLTQEIIDDVVLKAKGVEYGSITIAITEKPNKKVKVVDIITETRERHEVDVSGIPAAPEKRTV